MVIHQLVPGLRYGDAIGNQALAIRCLLRGWGIPSETFAAKGDERLMELAPERVAKQARRVVERLQGQ
jgi:hypothetical protein